VELGFVSYVCSTDFYLLFCPSSTHVHGFKTSEKVTADVVEIARQLELEVEPEVVTELLPSHDKTLTDEFLLIDEKGK
jgi:hypothetical protein